jgi:hypothetical protein
MSGDRYACALWTVGRFLYRPSASDLNVTAPDIVLAGVAAEIEAEISAMLRGSRSGKVVELCCGAIAVRNSAPMADKWISASALLRAPCAQREYCARSISSAIADSGGPHLRCTCERGCRNGGCAVDYIRCVSGVRNGSTVTLPTWTKPAWYRQEKGESGAHPRRQARHRLAGRRTLATRRRRAGRCLMGRLLMSALHNVTQCSEVLLAQVLALLRIAIRKTCDNCCYNFIFKIRYDLTYRLRFEIKLTPVLKIQIDEWRRRHPDIPCRAEAARLLIEQGLMAEHAAKAAA